MHIAAHQHYWDLSPRYMFGSDWPVCELTGSYIDVLTALQEFISSLSTEHQA